MYYRAVRLSAVTRTLVACWALWFTAALAEVPGVHSCSIHGAGSAHGGMNVASGHMHHGDAESSSSHAPANHHQQVCTCLGLCCCGAPTALPAVSSSVVPAMVLAASLVRDATVSAP